MKEIVFASNNAHKLEEIRSMTEGKFRVLSLQDIGFYEEIPEEAPTLKGNALAKALKIYQRFSLPTFSDDTGLEIEALGNAPGVYSARYAALDKATYPECTCTAEENIEKVLRLLKDVEPPRKACFSTVIAFISKEFSEPLYFDGKVYGEILMQKDGTQGFGYDPIFRPAEAGVSFAQMSEEEKNKISHRGRAFAQFVKFLEANYL